MIEAYPSVSNIAGGHGTGERGAAHAVEIIKRYSAEDAVIEDPAIEMIVRRSAVDSDLYDATRFSWKVSLSNASRAKLAFAVVNGLIIEVYEIHDWRPATAENFPGLAKYGDTSKRYGFIGEVADEVFQMKYRGKKVPRRKRGAANPIRYHLLR